MQHCWMEESQPQEWQTWFTCEGMTTLSGTGTSVLGLDSLVQYDLTEYALLMCPP